MNIVAQIAAVLAGLLHVMIFSFESLLFRRPTIHARFLVADSEVDIARPWAFNQGFYNLFLAIGAIGGVVMIHTGGAASGPTLALFACGCMLGAAVVLVGGERRMARAALMQGIFPLIALIAALF
jgi:putative membrane protein